MSKERPNPDATAAEVALVFDMDGTLLDGRAAVVDAVQEGLEATYRHFRLPIPACDRQQIAAAIGLPAPEFYRAAFDLQTVPLELRDRFIGEFEVRSTRAEVAALRRGETDLYEGAEETLATLAQRGHSLALISNANALYFEAVIKAHALKRFFQQCLSLESATRWRLARNKAGIVRFLAQDTRRAVVIGDRIHDIEAGRRCGAWTVGCLYGFGQPAELAAADWTISRLPEILTLPLAVPATGTAANILRANKIRKEAQG
jgi:phosphoglycolate phosphatase-like HAD superfamily hydrolase